MPHDPDDEDIFLACSKKLWKSELQIEGKKCKYSYHVETCAGIPEASLKKYAATWNSWRCQTCRAAGSPNGQSSRQAKVQRAVSGTQSDTQSCELNMAILVASRNAKLDTLLDLKKKVDVMIKSLQHMSDKQWRHAQAC